MIFQHHRFKVYSSAHHPYLHSLDDFAFNHPALPGVSGIESALNWIIAVLYPQSKAAVANVAVLPAVGNTINDMRVVQDDGDGKAASYRWEQREGEVSASWHKIYDLDFGTDSILQAYLLKTQDIYVKQRGYDDLDASGNAVTGILAGQSVFGGATANTNLTLFANSGDGTGSATGYVQFGDNARPTSHNTFDLGTTGSRFKKIWSLEYQAGTLNLLSGSISDSSGSLSFGSNNLSTTGTFQIGNFTVNGTANTIINSASSIGFGSSAITSTGDATFNKVTATGAASSFAANTTIADFTFANGSLTSSSATIGLGSNNLSTTGSGTFGRLDVDNIRVDGSTISNTSTNADTTISANGTGKVSFTSNTEVTSKNLTVSSGNLYVTNGFAEVTGTNSYLLVDNIRLNGNSIVSVDTNGDVGIVPDGTGLVAFGKGIYPTTTSSFDLGKTSFTWNNLWLTGSLKNGSNEITMSDLLSLRSTVYRDAARTTPAQAGDALFYNGSQWLASVPDTEIDHGTVSGLSDDDHTQYFLLSGRSGGTSAIGGTAASDNLTLESTSHATKGSIRVKDNTIPFTNASYSGGWSGTNLGGTSNYFKDVYTKGEHFGLRLENVSSNPSASTQNVGRMVYNTTDANCYVDTGTTIKKVGANRSETDTVWNGSDTSKNVTVSGVDATKAIWQLKDNTNNYESMYVPIRATSTTNVLITLGTALPAGTYRLVGIE